MLQQAEKFPLISPQDIEEWFDNFIASMRADEIQLQTATATTEKQSFYHMMISGDEDRMSLMVRNVTGLYFVKRIISDLFTELGKIHFSLSKIALGFSDSRVKVWVEVNDNDEKSEDDILLIEAKVNSKYYDSGIRLWVSITEKSEGSPLPLGYKLVFQQ
jgi:hypothetical protein